MSRMNFSTLKSVAYPARWTPPRYRFGQQVMHLGCERTITGMRYCIALIPENAPLVMEWRYEVDRLIFVPDAELEPIVMEAA